MIWWGYIDRYNEVHIKKYNGASIEAIYGMHNTPFLKRILDKVEAEDNEEDARRTILASLAISSLKRLP
jgi:hypothetical protein